MSKDEAESPTALQVGEKMPKDVASDDEPESSADKAKSDTSSSKAGTQASLAKSAAPSVENRYREDGSSLPTPPSNPHFESFANRVEASSSTLVKDPVASKKKAGEDEKESAPHEKESAPLPEDDSATIEDKSSLSAEGAHRASVLKKVVTKDSSPTNPPTTSAGEKSSDKKAPSSAEKGTNTEKQEEPRVIDDHVRESNGG